MATGGSNYTTTILSYQITADIINGFANIPQNHLKDPTTLYKVVGDNIISTLVSTGTPQQMSQMSSLSEKDQGDVLVSSIGMALADFYLINKDVIPDVQTFISATTLYVAQSPAPIPTISTKPVTVVATNTIKCKTDNAAYDGNVYACTNLHMAVIGMTILIAAIFFYSAYRKKSMAFNFY